MEPEDAKEIYAHFGVAFYYANCLEHCIVDALCLLSLLPNRKVCSSRKEWANLVDKHYEDHFKGTLGLLKRKLELHKDAFPSLSAVIPDLEKCLEERNFLAHHFWREYAQHWLSIKGRKEMIERLEIARKLFKITDEKLDNILQPLFQKYGMTAERLEKLYSEWELEGRNY